MTNKWMNLAVRGSFSPFPEQSSARQEPGAPKHPQALELTLKDSVCWEDAGGLRKEVPGSMRKGRSIKHAYT